jgi:hypothetical protein
MMASRRRLVTGNYQALGSMDRVTSTAWGYDMACTFKHSGNVIGWPKGFARTNYPGYVQV